jgi:hypothetical protein
MDALPRILTQQHEENEPGEEDNEPHQASGEPRQ